MTGGGAGDRVALVTGATSGLGVEIARRLVADGLRVVISGRSKERGEAVAADLGAASRFVPADLARSGAAQALVDDVLVVEGRLDVLVNNAAVAPGPDNVHRIGEVSYDDWQRTWRRMVDVDLLGAANVTYGVATHLIERGATGAIVNVGSRGAYRGEPDYPAYGASKAALHAFGQSMAVALAPHGITVASVAPGFVGTERQQAKLAGPEGAAVTAQSPFGRVGTPQEVAAAVIHLSSPEAAWSSGAVLDLNGASYLR